MNRKQPAATFTPEEPRDDWALTIPEPLLPGLYPATIEKVTLRTSEADGREWLAWEFVLEDGRRTQGGSSYATSPRSKSFAWLTAVLGRRRIAGGATITPADLIGQPCTISIIEDAEGFDKVDAVLPPVGGHPTPSPSIDELIDEVPAG